MATQTQANTQTQFRTIPNVAQYGGADWSNFIKTVPGLTVDKAKALAQEDDKITFFFFCKQGMTLAPCGKEQSHTFQAGDAVFFSGEPWLGSAPQCDTYRLQTYGSGK